MEKDSLTDSSVSSASDITSIMWQFTKRNMGMTVSYLGLVILTTILGIVLVSKVTARFQKNVSDADVSQGYRSLFSMMLILLGTFVLGYVTDLLENRLFPQFVAFAQASMFNLILSKNEASPNVNVDANVYRQVMQRTSSSASHVYQQLLYTLIPNSIVLLVMFVFLFRLNWRFGLVFFGVALLVSAIALFAKESIMTKAKCQETLNKETEWRAFDILFNLQLVVSKDMVRAESDYITSELNVVCTNQIAYLQMIDNLGYIVQMISYAGMFLVFLLALNLFGTSTQKDPSKKNKDHGAKQVLTLISVLTGVRVRLQHLTKSQINTVDSVGKYGHIKSVVNDIHSKTITQGVHTTPKDTSVVFQNVSFSYGDKQVLRDVSLTIAPFETVAIKGQSGSGKTTLVSMCLRTLAPQTGHVEIGQRPIAHYSLSALKKIVAVVNPDQGILNRTIRENIMFGCPPSEYAAKTKEANRIWTQFQHVFDGKTMDSPVGKGGGSALSTGQKQLVRMMNLLVCGNNTILILDEPVNGLDEHTKKHVLTMIDNIRKSRSRTIIIITHDEDCAKVSDRVCVMTKGTLVALPNQKE